MIDRVFPRTTLSTSRLVLRAFEPDDAADVHAAWNDEAYVWFAPKGFAHAGAGIEQAAEWCSHGAEEVRTAGKGINLAGTERDGGRLLCHVALFGVDWTAMTAEIHYWTGPWARGKGYAAEAGRAVARWAVTDLGFARIALQALTGNAASLRVAESAGFRYEGTQRNAALTAAGRGDLAVYSLIPEDLGPA